MGVPGIQPNPPFFWEHKILIEKCKSHRKIIIGFIEIFAAETVIQFRLTGHWKQIKTFYLLSAPGVHKNLGGQFPNIEHSDRFVLKQCI